MALHDAYLRRTPVELAFPDRDAAAEFVAEVVTEARDAGVDAGLRQAFFALPAVSRALGRLRPGEPRPEATYDYAMLLYHAFHFQHAGAYTLLVGEETARALVDGRAGDGPPVAPAPAGYAQLPRNLFWIRAAPGETPEAVDGLFWTLAEEGWVHVLLAVGIRPDRPGLAVVPVPEAPWAEAPSWVAAPMRSDALDFATTLPGGELEALYSLETAGEVLKLVARLFAHLHANPDALAVGAPPAGAGGPPPSVLPYKRIELHAEGVQEGPR
jgi:hypothetical protein